MPHWYLLGMNDNSIKVVYVEVKESVCILEEMFVNLNNFSLTDVSF